MTEFTKPILLLKLQFDLAFQEESLKKLDLTVQEISQNFAHKLSVAIGQCTKSYLVFCTLNFFFTLTLPVLSPISLQGQ